MLKVGLLVGRERSFPDALINEVNSRNAGVIAEYVKVGEVSSSAVCDYNVIVDRISHEVVFYQPYLKAAALSGTVVINNPFWRLADDKFFGTALVERLGVSVPEDPDPAFARLPGRDNPRKPQQPQIPARLAGHSRLHGAARDPQAALGRRVERCLARQQHRRAACGLQPDRPPLHDVQEFIDWQQYVRCLCVGKTNILITNWDPRRPHFERYRNVEQQLEPQLEERIRRDAIKINEALGYDMNTVEFGVRDGVPYAIDFMNSAPDFDISSLTEAYFPWVVRAMADLVIERAREAPDRRPQYRWDALLNHG